MDAEIKAARTAVDAIVSDVRTRAGALVEPARGRDAGRQRITTGVTGELKRAAVEELDKLRERTGPAPTAPAEPPAPATPPTVGSRVRIENLGLEGNLVALQGDHADVEARGKRLRVRIGNLRVVEAPPASGGGVTVAVAANTVAPEELNVIGCRVEEALSRVEKYVDQALLGGVGQLRVIHGHGTGQLRRAIAGFLDEHPLVAKFEAAAPEHGGRGVTMIELKD